MDLNNDARQMIELEVTILSDLQKGGFIEHEIGYDGRIDSGYIAHKLTQKGRNILLTKKLRPSK